MIRLLSINTMKELVGQDILGLAENQINYLARIVSIADAMSLTSERNYMPSLSASDALEYIMIMQYSI